MQANYNNYKQIYDFINSTYNKIIYDYDSSGWSHADITTPVCFPKHNSFHQSDGDSTYTEITYQQFEEHVLKKSVVKQKENYDYLIPIIEKLNKS